ncbi:hypothetical protein MP631_18505 [Xanthomonas phaseoli pv. phaseoli]|nr:hypothetical protein MP631_18505 [Xanthomonas phaseoli pv. phaseoli]
MRKKWIFTSFIKAALGLTSLTVASFCWSQESSVVLNPKLDSADAALMSGNTSALDSMLSAKPGNEAYVELLEAYKARISSDTQGSNTHAKRCADLAKKSLDASYDINFRCKSLLAGNALIDGDYPHFSRLVHSATSDVEPFVRQSVAALVPSQYTSDVRVLAPPAVSVPIIRDKSPRFSTAPGTHVNPRIFKRSEAPENAAAMRVEPFRVNARVNGTDATFAFDTGGSATVIGEPLLAPLGSHGEVAPETSNTIYSLKSEAFRCSSHISIAFTSRDSTLRTSPFSLVRIPA